MTQPLNGVRVLELAGLAPVPFLGMVLSDFGADVVRVDRSAGGFNADILARGKKSIAVSLKSPAGIDLIRTLVSPASPPTSSCSNAKCKCAKEKVVGCKNNKGVWRADILLDPFRPGVLERLGLDPIDLLKRNPRLIIARLTGFRRSGPYAKMAGHDINYIALSGMLNLLGRKGDKPSFPANLLGDFAGGGIMGVVGVMMALYEREKSGLGQIVEIDMVTGTRYISTFATLMTRPSLNLPLWDGPRGTNVLDGGSPWYEVYETKDGRFMSVGCIETQFYNLFLNMMIESSPASILPSPVPTVDQQHDRSTWPTLASFFTSVFLTKTMNEWTALFIGTDACVAPVLDHRREIDGLGVTTHEPGFQLSPAEGEEGGIPCPAPSLSRTPGRKIGELYTKEGEGFLLDAGKDTRSFLEMAGIKKEEFDDLVSKGVVEVGDEVKSKL